MILLRHTVSSSVCSAASSSRHDAGIGTAMPRRARRGARGYTYCTGPGVGTSMMIGPCPPAGLGAGAAAGAASAGAGADASTGAEASGGLLLVAGLDAGAAGAAAAAGLAAGLAAGGAGAVLGGGGGAAGADCGSGGAAAGGGTAAGDAAGAGAWAGLGRMGGGCAAQHHQRLAGPSAKETLIGCLLGCIPAAAEGVAVEHISRRIPPENRNHTIRCVFSSADRFCGPLERNLCVEEGRSYDRK
jgi:hypothetical protein